MGGLIRAGTTGMSEGNDHRKYSAIYRCSCWMIFRSPECGE
jgi:hypothetical protein